MRVALVSQYFPPEIGATQNRMAAFTSGLAEHGHQVTVVCEQPNHPAGVFLPGWGRRPIVTERHDVITVHRLWVATSPAKTTSRRVAFYGTFAGGAFARLLTLPRPDVVFATSPPLPGAWAAATAAGLRGIPFVLDVRDLWPAAAAALGELSNPRLLRAFEYGERWIYRKAARVTATTRPFCRHIDATVGRHIAVHLPNGALDVLLSRPDSLPPANGGFVVGYAGNLGLAQGIRIALDAAERLRGTSIRFRLAGSGPLASQLEHERADRGISNLTIEPAMPVEQVADFLESCHALLIPLRDHPLLSEFIPSKLYDAMAAGRPAIVAARGEAAALVADTACGIVIRPEDGRALANAARSLEADPRLARRLGEAGRQAAQEHARSRQIERLVEILSRAADRDLLAS